LGSFPHWRLPSSAVGSVDLRPLPAQSLAGGAPQGFAFCASPEPVGVVIGTGEHIREVAVTTAMQDAWQSVMGYRPQGAKLVDLLWDQITNGSAPSGDEGPKPLLPGVDLQLKLHLGGHSLVKSERFRFGIHPHTNRIRDLLRRDFEAQWEASNGHDRCRRCLDFTCDKYRVKDWREFVPARLHAHVPGRLPHATTITENFTGTSDTLGNVLSWTELEGDWDRESDQGQPKNAGQNTARAESDLSSDDHYVQVAYSDLTSNLPNAGVSARFSASELTYYQFDVDSGSDWRTFKRVTGSYTAVGSTSAQAVSANDIIKGECDGSTIARYYNGVSQNSTTDTTITGNTRGGLNGFNGNAGTKRVDNFEAADLAAPPADAPKRLMLLGVG
jgi:hypothetical protein